MPACTQCGRKTFGTRTTCLYCGGAMAVEARTHLNCPRCNAPMRRDTVEGIELDLCAGCGGTWYDRDELEQRLTATDPPPTDAPGLRSDGEFRRKADTMDTSYLPCPICAKPMTRKNWGRLSGVIVDVCGPHGLFLDGGEFERIRDFEGSGTKDRAERLGAWEKKSSDEARKKGEADVRRDFHRELRRSRALWWNPFC